MSYDIDKESGIESEEAVDGTEKMKNEVLTVLPALAKSPHILVIDDDPLFRAQVRRIAAKRQIDVTVCSSLREVDTMSDSRLFDIAVVDYYLDDMKSYLRGTDIASVFEATPVVLISNTDRGIVNASPFPNSVRRFVNKRIGISAILDEAIKTVNPNPETWARRE